MTSEASIAQSIRDDASFDLDPLRRYLATMIGRTRAPGEGVGSHVSAPSVELDNVVVRVSVQVSDPSYLGTFDRTADTRMVQVFLNARVSGTDEVTPTRGPRSVDLPVEEQVAWARAVLGDLADYSYRVLSDTSQLRVRPSIVVVFVDGTTPRLAPSDFTWLLVCGGRRAYPEKLVPEDPDLLSQLRRGGDMVRADNVAHPKAPTQPGVWAAEFVSQLSATIADELGRMGNDKSFTFEEISLHGSSRVVVRYTWHLVAGDKKFGFDIDVPGIRARYLRERDDPRPRVAARTIGATPFGQPVFRSPEVVVGVTWVRFGDN